MKSIVSFINDVVLNLNQTLHFGFHVNIHRFISDSLTGFTVSSPSGFL